MLRFKQIYAAKRMAWVLAALLLLSNSLAASAIVFVHIGDSLPAHADKSLAQARLFNPNTPIYMVSSTQALSSLNAPVIKVAYETLQKSPEHLEFLAKRTVPEYWRFVVERFFYLDELITKHRLRDVLHLENDVMIYFELDSLIPTFRRCFPGIGVTFLNDNQCIPGIVYIPNKDKLRALMPSFAALGGIGHNDMAIFVYIRRQNSKNVIDILPMIPKSYIEESSHLGMRVPHTSDPSCYAAYTETFNSIFDGAALGQYLGGRDGLFGPPMPGFINGDSVFNPSRFEYTWELDRKGRNIPYAHHAGRKYRINNLHIHSKELEKFKS